MDKCNTENNNKTQLIQNSNSKTSATYQSTIYTFVYEFVQYRQRGKFSIHFLCISHKNLNSVQTATILWMHAYCCCIIHGTIRSLFVLYHTVSAVLWGIVFKQNYKSFYIFRDVEDAFTLQCFPYSSSLCV